VPQLPQKPIPSAATAATPATPPAALAEATETQAQTQQEAAHGDPQAVRTLAKHAHHHKVANPSPPGTGTRIKVTA